jgi:hypothetical protein
LNSIEKIAKTILDPSLFRRLSILGRFVQRANIQVMHWAVKLVVILAVSSVAANAQCAIYCAFENCESTEAPPSHCHHDSTPDKGKPPGSQCSHEVSVLDANAKTFHVNCVSLLVADLTPLPTVRPAQLFSYTGISPDISPHTLDIPSITVLRI